jgi:hypothetical protein
LRSSIAAIEEYSGWHRAFFGIAELFCSKSIEEDTCMSFGMF